MLRVCLLRCFFLSQNRKFRAFRKRFGAWNTRDCCYLEILKSLNLAPTSMSWSKSLRLHIFSQFDVWCGYWPVSAWCYAMCILNQVVVDSNKWLIKKPTVALCFQIFYSFTRQRNTLAGKVCPQSIFYSRKLCMAEKHNALLIYKLLILYYERFFFSYNSKPHHIFLLSYSIYLIYTRK